jgi:hypothetical protein
LQHAVSARRCTLRGWRRAAGVEWTWTWWPCGHDGCQHIADSLQFSSDERKACALQTKLISTPGPDVDQHDVCDDIWPQTGSPSHWRLQLTVACVSMAAANFILSPERICSCEICRFVAGSGCRWERAMRNGKVGGEGSLTHLERLLEVLKHARNGPSTRVGPPAPFPSLARSLAL